MIFQKDMELREADSYFLHFAYVGITTLKQEEAQDFETRNNDNLHMFL